MRARLEHELPLRGILPVHVRIQLDQTRLRYAASHRLPAVAGKLRDVILLRSRVGCNVASQFGIRTVNPSEPP